MHLHRKNNKAEGESYRGYKEIDKYIELIVNIYSSSEVKRDHWLTDREKEFFIATVIHVIKGYKNPISKEAIQIYKKYFSPTTNKTKISDYINRVRAKKWIQYNKRTKVIDIPQIFHGIDESGDTISFKLNFSYEPNDR